MNQRRMDEMIVKAQVRMAERLVKWEQKWLGDRVNYGDQLGSDVFAGIELRAAGTEAGETDLEAFKEEETDLYGQEE